MHTIRMSREDREVYLRSRERFDRGDAGALPSLLDLSDRYPRYADVHYMSGVLLERDGELEAATNRLERALEINPTYAEAAVALLAVYEQRGQPERTRELTEALANNPIARDTTRGKLANLQAALGDAYREAGEIRDAIVAYRKALDFCPGYHDIRHRLGIALREAGLPARAASELRRVLRANPDYAEARIQLGLTQYSLGRTAEARAEWAAVLEDAPGNEAAAMYLRMLDGSAPNPAFAATARDEPAED